MKIDERKISFVVKVVFDFTILGLIFFHIIVHAQPVSAPPKFNLGADPSQEQIKNAVKEIYAIQFNAPDEAIRLGNQLLQLKNISEVDRAYAHMGIATSYSINGKESYALKQMEAAILVAEKTKNWQLRSNTNLAMVNIYHKMEQYESASRHIIKVEKEIANERNEITRNFILMRLYSQQIKNNDLQGRYLLGLSSALKSFSAANQYIKKRTKSDILPITDILGILGNTGEVFFNAGKMTEAETFFNREWNLSKETSTDIDYEKLYTYGNLAKIYLTREEYKRAADTALAALKVDNLDNTALHAELYRTISQSYKHLDDYKNYVYYNEKYQSLQKELSVDERKALNRVVLQMEKYEKEAVEKERNKWLLTGLAALLIGCLLVGYIIYRKRTVPENTEIRDLPKDASTPLTIPDETVEKIMQKLNKFEEAEKFLNPKISLSQLSSSFGFNSAYISDTINKKHGKNFNRYINELRIEYICNKLRNEPAYRNYKLEHLATVCGFSSHSTFTKIFKNITGITPSKYIESLKS